MAKVQIDTPAPEFTLTGLAGNAVSLTNYRNEKHVVLVFNRGFQ